MGCKGVFYERQNGVGCSPHACAFLSSLWHSIPGPAVTLIDALALCMFERQYTVYAIFESMQPFGHCSKAS